MEKKKNETLEELMAGILTAGVLIQIVELILSVVYPQFGGRTRTSFTIGLWAGVITAEGLAMHMSRSISIALDLLPQDAEGYMRKAYFIRTAIILAVAGLVHYLKLGHVLATFLGVMCLKFGAFLQPLMHRVLPDRLPETGYDADQDNAEMSDQTEAEEMDWERKDGPDESREEYISRIEKRIENRGKKGNRH